MPNPKILCLDDEKSILDSLQRTLRSEYELACFCDPREALDHLKENPDFDLIICDFKMPEMLGSDVLSQIAENYTHIGRILLSAEVNNEYLMEGINKNHFHKLILKPWEPAYLKFQIQEALIHNKTLSEKNKFEHLSKIDPVTGLYNHRHFQFCLDEQIQNPSSSCALLLADIDFFKSFNDRYGHLEGDLVLREVARRLKKTAPSEALVFRYGGEEFALLVFGIDENQLLAISESLRKAISDESIRSIEGIDLHVTLSLGAHLIDIYKDKNEAIRAVDSALYTAKDKGRNRVEILKMAT